MKSTDLKLSLIQSALGEINRLLKEKSYQIYYNKESGMYSIYKLVAHTSMMPLTEKVISVRNGYEVSEFGTLDDTLTELEHQISVYIASKSPAVDGSKYLKEPKKEFFYTSKIMPEYSELMDSESYKNYCKWFLEQNLGKDTNLIYAVETIENGKHKNNFNDVAIAGHIRLAYEFIGLEGWGTG